MRLKKLILPTVFVALCAVFVAIALMAFRARFVEAPAEDKPWVLIRAGFVFRDGQYEPPPYDVRSVDCGIKLNGWWVKQPPVKSIQTPKEDPGPFRWTPELLAKGMEYSGFNDSAMARYLFWESRYGFDNACSRFEAYLKEQPLVDWTGGYSSGDRFDLSYQTKDGDIDAFSLPAPNPEAAEWGKSQDIDVASLRKTLLSGGALFFTSAGPKLVSAETLRARLPRAYDILASTRTPGEKAKLLVEIGFVPGRLSGEYFADGFRDSPELRARVEKLREVGAKE